MLEILLQILKIAYAGVSVIFLIGYLPTIKDLWIHKKRSTNISSYTIWAVGFGITFLYSLFIIPDLLFQIFSALNFASCALILLLSATLKYKRQ